MEIFPFPEVSILVISCSTDKETKTLPEIKSLIVHTDEYYIRITALLSTFKLLRLLVIMLRNCLPHVIYLEIPLLF